MDCCEIWNAPRPSGRLDADASDLILGDAITTTLRGILISTYNGDLATLQAVIEAKRADAFARAPCSPSPAS
ncbi:MAG: DUF1186 domain-containing protein [Acetobacteraceae bacterium]|nr:DUF1186 domain-containing protein [Acetobacteraceae bacterium]